MIGFNTFLHEGISQILYHLTDISKTLSILDKDKFILSTDLGTESDQLHKGKKFKPFFLSTSRIKYGGYTMSFGKNPTYPLVNIVLDGTALSHNYSGHSVDYWGREWRKNIGDYSYLRNNENEDRIFSDKGTIENAHKFIKEVHIFLGGDLIKFLKYDEESNKMSENEQRICYQHLKDIGHIISLCRIYNIYFFVYDNFNAFKVLNKNKKIAKRFDISSYDNRIENYNELFVKNDKSELSDGAEKELYNLLYYNWNGDAFQTLKNEIHNLSKSDETIKKRSIHSFVKYMHKYKLKSIKDVIQFLNDKWRNKDKE